MSETSQQNDTESGKPEAKAQEAEASKASASPVDQGAPGSDIPSQPEREATRLAAGTVTAGAQHAPGRDPDVKKDAPTPILPQLDLKEESTGTTGQVMNTTMPALDPSREKAGNLQATMLENLKVTQKELNEARTPTSEAPQEKELPKSRELKCKSCIHCKDERVPAAIFQSMDDGKSIAIKFNPKCGHPCTIVINNSFEITDHVCTSYVEKEVEQGGDNVFDFERFIEGSEELDDFLLKQQTKRASRLVSLEDQMKVAVKKLVKPLAMLVPTAVQKKSEAQLRAERDDRLRQIVEIEANVIYLRVLEFEKAAAGGNSYPIDKLSKMLKDLDKRYITGFIQKINNEFLISYSEQTQTVRFYNPSKPELEILSREFEKWLRFNRL